MSPEVDSTIPSWRGPAFFVVLIFAAFALMIWVGMAVRDEPQPARYSIVWSKEMRSPDEFWMARTRLEQPSKNVGGDIHVYIARAYDPQDEMEILKFKGSNPSPDQVEMKWLSADSLEVSYSKSLTMTMQTVMTGGIDIYVRRLPE